jgi:PKD repeat protein
MSVSLDVRPGASGVGCTEILISNEGAATIDVDVQISGSGVTISPGALSVTLGGGASITVPVCALALTQSSHKQVQVTALASGRESNTQQGQVNKNGGFTVIIEQYARLSMRADQPYSEFCRDSIFDANFTVINYGNDVDTIRLEIINQKDLENAGFTVALSQPLIELDSQGDMTVPITVRAGNATKIVEKGNYTLIVKASTTLVGETEARSVTATLHIIECEEIEEIAEVPPVAIADDDWNSQSQVLPGVVVSFTGIGTDEDGNIVLYEWDFNGDGVYEWSSNESGNATFTFNREGTYTAVLRVTDNDGLTATDSRVITVGDGGGSDVDSGFLPAPSLAASVAAVAIIALRRPRKP